MNAPLRRPQDPEASRAAILQAAEELFVQEGFAGTSMSEIAKASGVTKSLIHHHFGSKEGLWEEVKRTAFSEYHEQQLELFATTEPSPELLERSLAVYFRFLRKKPHLVRLMSWMHLEEDRVCSEMLEELCTRGIERIEAAQAGGLLRTDVPARHILMIFLGIVHTWFNEQTTVPVVEDPDADAEVYLESAWKIFSTGLVVR